MPHSTWAWSLVSIGAGVVMAVISAFLANHPLLGQALLCFGFALILVGAARLTWPHVPPRVRAYRVYWPLKRSGAVVHCPSASSVANSPQDQDTESSSTSIPHVAGAGNDLSNQPSDISATREAVLQTNATPNHAPSEVYSEEWEDPLNLRALFSVDYRNKTVHLLFSPYSRQPRADTLLLILFGFRKFFGVREVPVNTANTCMMKSKVSDPNNVFGYIFALHGMTSSLDTARDHLPGEVSITGLSRGGYLAITEKGYREAYFAASDLIAKA